MKRWICLVMLVAFTLTGVLPSSYAQSVLSLPPPGQMVALSPAFNPPVLKGIKVYPDNPLRFDFILDKGDDKSTDEQIKIDSTRLIKYFLASLTIPEKDLWVNLSPYEKDRIVPEAFGQTEMGRDLLAQDYLLKQITASVIYPEGDIGKKFWKKIYALAQEKYGTTDIPVDTFNKVWIVPEKAVVYENGKVGAAYVTESRLKVMLESDYLAQEKNAVAQTGNETNEIAKEVMREVVIPKLEREVNEGKNFSQLRQVYHSLILAVWYKDKVKESLLGKAYVDQNKTGGVDIEDKAEKEKIWAQYVEAFKKGVYNYIKEDLDFVIQSSVPRKYFSGGASFGLTRSRLIRKDAAQGKFSEEVSRSDFTVQVGFDTVDYSMTQDRAMLSVRKWLKRGALALAVSAAVGGGAYSWMRWGYDISFKQMIMLPHAQPEIVFQSGHIVKYDGHVFRVTDVLSYRTTEVNDAIKAKKANREFWVKMFSDYPPNFPISAVLTLDVIQNSYQTGQLDNLFNGLRTKPDLVYRYLSEIPDEQMPEFTQYFAKLRPGIRQQIFQIVYRRLSETYQILENGETIKSILFETSLRQAERMRKLYGEMARILNVIQPPQDGGIPEGPLIMAPDKPIAPYEETTFTKQQAAEGLYASIAQSVDVYRRKGYTVVMPQADQVNMGDLEGLVSHYSSAYMLGKQSFYVDNKAGRLLQWVQETTSSNNPSAHRITQKELIEQALRYSEDPVRKTVDLFDAIATISHLFKSLARNPDRLLGAHWVMEGQDGVDYIWNHFQPNILAYSLYNNGAESVDDQGRPVIFWRPVDLDGNNSVPLGQKTGIKRPDTGHDFYHGWGILLLDIYARLKSFHEVKVDLYGQKPIDIAYIRSRLGLTNSKERYNFGSADMDYLPLFFNIAQSLGIEEFGLSRSKFSKKNGSEPEMIFARIGSRIAGDVLQNNVMPDSGKRPRIVTLDATGENRSFLKSLQGGIDLDSYVGRLNDRWKELRENPSVRAIQEKARLVETANQVLTLEELLGKGVPISNDLRQYLFSSVKTNHLSDEELNIQLAVFKEGYVKLWNDYTDIKAPFIYDVLAYVSEPPQLGRLESVKQQLAALCHLLPETYQRLANDSNSKIRAALVENKYLPEAVLAQILSDKDFNVVLAYFTAGSFTLNEVPASIRSMDSVKPIMVLLSKEGPLVERKRIYYQLKAQHLEVDPNVFNNLSVRAFDEYMPDNDAGDQSKDQAMLNMPGGIDLTRDKVKLQVQRSEIGIQFKFDPAMIQQLQNASGLTPEIIDIRPMTITVSMFLGSNDEHPRLVN